MPRSIFFPSSPSVGEYYSTTDKLSPINWLIGWRWPGLPPAACLNHSNRTRSTRIIGDERERWGSTSKGSNDIVPNDETTFPQSHAGVKRQQAQLFDFASGCTACKQVLFKWHIETIMVTWDFTGETRALLLASKVFSLATAKTFCFPTLTVVSLLKNHRRAS